MREASAFYQDVLFEYHKNCGLVVAPSTSPEVGYIHTSGQRIGHTAGSAIDQQIVYELFGHTAEAARILGVDEDLAQFTGARRVRGGHRVAGWHLKGGGSALTKRASRNTALQRCGTTA